MSAPLRFLGVVIGGWTAARVVALMWTGAPPVSVAPVQKPVVLAMVAPTAPLALLAVPVRAAIVTQGVGAVAPITTSPSSNTRSPRLALSHPLAVVEVNPPLGVAVIPSTPTSAAAARNSAPVVAAVASGGFARAFAPAPIVARAADRLSVSAWALARPGGGGDALAAAGGLLGASQAGARLLYRVSDGTATPVSLSARLSSPLRRSGTEAAVGVEWQPVAGLPIRLLAERRERVSGEGRSAFALLAHGGVGDRPIAAGFTLDAYAQAGVVGAHKRDLFADGGATLVRPVAGSVALGAGVWGGTQPGATRLDVGPRATAVLGAGSMRVRASLDWRFRVGGRAAPASGPSLTIGTDF